MSDTDTTRALREQISELRERLTAAEDDLSRTLIAMRRAGRQTCRQCRLRWPSKTDPRGVSPAEFLIWGKLFPPEALGPSCREHTAAALNELSFGHAALGDVDQWAVFDLRPLLDPLGASKYVTADELHAFQTGNTQP